MRHRADDQADQADYEGRLVKRKEERRANFPFIASFQNVTSCVLATGF